MSVTSFHASADLPELGVRAIPEPPINLEMEQQALGCLLSNEHLFDRVAEFLEAEHFADDLHARIFAAIRQLWERGGAINAFSVAQFFGDEAATNTQSVGGYIAQLTASTITTLNLTYYAQKVFEYWQRRQLLRAALDLVESSSIIDQEVSVAEAAASAEEEIFRISKVGKGRHPVVSLYDAGQSALHQIEAAFKNKGIVGLKTGLPRLDSLIGGFKHGQLIVCGARPSIGKTSFAWTIVSNMARANDTAASAFFTQEMDATQLSQKEIAARTGISTQRQDEGDFDFAAMQKIALAAEGFKGLPVFSDQNSRQSAGAILQQTRRLIRKHGVKLVVIDHLQLMRQSGKQEARRLEVGDITGQLKALARDHGVSVLLLSQLSRNVEQRDDKRPQLSDLRESGDIEQDADVVMFLYREEYYLSKAKPQQRPDESDSAFGSRLAIYDERLAAVLGRAEVIVAKNRTGRTGTVNLFFDGPRQRFENEEYNGWSG